MVRIMIALVLMCGAARAETPMTGAEFDAYTRGLTLSYDANGQLFGAEQYRPGRRVIWTFADGVCQAGRWFEPEPAKICFIYENSSNGPHCWQFFDTGRGLRARLFDEPGSGALFESHSSSRPLNCAGPKVGV